MTAQAAEQDRPVAAPPPEPTGASGHDEMVTGAGAVRPAWAPLLGAIHAMRPGSFGLRAERVARQYEETRVAYAEAGGPQLDPVPMLLPMPEWERVTAGLAQRARLLDAIAADLYGERRLLRGGVVPAAVAFANPHFLRPCVGLAPPGGTHVHAYAADLVRLHGTWHVAADRLQAPNGIGLALQNRVVLARTMPELFRAYAVPRLEPFFELWHARLAALAPLRTGQPPRIALLTPGPFAPSYLEHVFLARQLGALLVEGGDLTMRDGRVHLKTLAALAPIDVLLRFMDDDYTDPLELRSDSVLGVPGLLQAVRAGRLVMLNPPGASVVESPLLRPRLPDLARLLLGEALALPSVPPGWRGTPARSVAPAWDGERLEPRPVTLRVFLVHDGRDYVAMPGGCTDVADPRGRVVKDTWLVAGDLHPAGAALPATRQPPLPIGLAPDDLRSRNADDLFWLGRYAERLDNAARLVRAMALRLAGEALGPGEQAELAHLVRLLAAQHLAGPALAEAMPDARALVAALAALWAGEAPLAGVFRSVASIAQSLRGRLSKDVGIVVLGPLARVRERLAAAGDADALIAGLETLIGVVAAFGGMASENMTQGGGWRFLDLGRRLERALYAGAVLAELVPARPGGEGPLALALELSDSAITYHSRYLGAVQPGPVADVLLRDRRNPRSGSFQLSRIGKHLRELAEVFDRADSPGVAAAEALLAQALEARLEALHEPAAAQALAATLEDARTRLHALSDLLSRAYFAHTRMPQAVGYAAARA